MSSVIINNVEFKPVKADRLDIIANGKRQGTIMCGPNSYEVWSPFGSGWPIRLSANTLDEAKTKALDVLKQEFANSIKNHETAISDLERRIDDLDGVSFNSRHTVLYKYLLAEVKFRLHDDGCLGLDPKDTTDEMIADLAEQLWEEHSIVFNYDQIDDFLSKRLEEDYGFDLNREDDGE